MRNEFVATATKKEALELCPWACEVIEVKGGYHAFESRTEAEVFINQDGAGTLHDYDTGEQIRTATPAEALDSMDASDHDGGGGVILVDDRRCYVQN